jgi:hypothetical protein
MDSPNVPSNEPRDTQPIHPNTHIQNTSELVSPVHQLNIPQKNHLKPNTEWLWMSFACILFFIGGLVGELAGSRSADEERQETQSIQSIVNLQDQYLRGLDDVQAGRYDIARQRFVYILSQDPNFPGAGDQLAEVNHILNATATFTPVPPTATASPTIRPTPTPDLRPAADLLAQAQVALEKADWDQAIDLIVTLRKVDLRYQITQVDDLLFVALRNRGVDKIYKERDLEGGSYDLSLAERFGPLDAAANQARTLARLYMYGSAFWEAYPQQAVNYFGQVAAAVPYLTDASGWTAIERYRAALMQYGDQLAGSGDWCNAQTQYTLAASIRSDDNLRSTATYVAEMCSPPTPKPTHTPSPTMTTVPVATFTTSPTSVPTVIPDSPTPVPTTLPAATNTIQSTDTPTPTVNTVTPTNTTVPTTEPTTSPTTLPTTEPTSLPSPEPTTLPTAEPTLLPTIEPTTLPTIKPPTVTATPSPTSGEPTATSTPVPPTASPVPSNTISYPTITPTSTPSETVVPG